MGKFGKILPKNAKKFDDFFLKYWGLSGAKACKSCRSRQELSNEYLFATQVFVLLARPREVMGDGLPATALVERFDIEPYSDFSAKWSNFMRLVLCCIDAKFCKKIFVGKLLTRSTRFTFFCIAQTSIFQNYVNASIPKEKTGGLSFFESSIFIKRLTVWV